MEKVDLKLRTKNFSVSIIRFLDKVPNKLATAVIAKQLLRSATSIGANYREACRARSKKEFISKLGVVLGEADETLYWLEILRDTGSVDNGELDLLCDECNELVAIFTTSCRTANGKEDKQGGVQNADFRMQKFFDEICIHHSAFLLGG